jgi:hypothetical protein
MSFRDCEISVLYLNSTLVYNNLHDQVLAIVFNCVRNHWIVPSTSATSSSTIFATESGISIM